jgi:hypothetical protein
MIHPSRPTTIAILGGDPVAEAALALLLKGEGYHPRRIERDLVGTVDRLEGVDLLLFAPGVPKEVRDCLLSAVRANPTTARIPALRLSSVMGELLDGDSSTLIPWPSPISVLIQEIETAISINTGEEG